jgi:hypothetical protein
MNGKTFIAMAGNTFAAAFAVLKSLGYTVTHVTGPDGQPNGLIQAENHSCVLQAPDPVVLLGLVRLYESRGAGWKSTGAEVDEFLGFQAEAL